MKHSQEYTINGKKYVAHAFFMGNMLHIKNDNNKTVYSCCLDSYTNYQGNMESFVNEIVALKDKGKTTMTIKDNRSK